MKTHKLFLKKILLIILFLFVLVSGSLPENEKNTKNKIILNTAQYTNSVRIKMREQLINDVRCYIKTTSPDSKLSADKLVDICLKYDFDIVFALSQGILESHLGTKGTAVKTNSVWNVGTYDNGKILYYYNHPDDAIEPYVKLISEQYLMYDKNFTDLLNDHGYKNNNGQRYASTKTYENKLRKIIIKINSETSITLYQSILKLNNNELISYFCPIDSYNVINW